MKGWALPPRVKLCTHLGPKSEGVLVTVTI